MTRSRWAAIASTCYVGTAALTLLNGLPAIAVTLQDNRQLSNDAIGWLAAAHVLALGLSSAACPYFLREFGARTLIAIASILVAIGFAVLGLCASPPPTYAGFILTGVGTGIANAVAYVLLGESHQERNVAVYYSAQWLSTWLLLSAIPKISLIAGLGGTFLCLAAFNVLSLATLPLIANSCTQLPVGVPGRARARIWLRSIALLGLCATFACQGAIWTFLEIAGRRRGFLAAAVDAAAAGSAVFGLLGSLVAVVVGRRYGQTIPLFVSAGALSLSLACMTDVHWVIYLSGVCLFTLSYSIFCAYIFGLATDHDTSGFTAAWASTASCVGYASGPAAAGAISDVFGTNGVIGVGVVCAAIAFVAVAILLRTLPGHGWSTSDDCLATRGGG